MILKSIGRPPLFLRADALLIAFLIWAAGVAWAETNVLFYPVPPDLCGDGKVEATVDGAPVAFEFFRNYPTYYYDIHYCRFAADGPVEVSLTIQANFQKAFLRGLLCDIPFSRNGKVLSFSLPGPGHYYLQLPDVLSPVPGNEDSGTCTIAFWIDDLNEANEQKLDPEHTKVLVVTAHGVVSHPAKNQTAVIQSILDKGGRIFFPAGIYRTGKLTIQSNTEIYLAPGAVLKAVDNLAAIDSRYILISNAAQIKIHGPGTIDANSGASFQEKKNIHIIDIVDSHHLELEDVCLRNCNSWALHLFGSDQIRCHNIRILSGKDGIDPDSASDVMIDGVFIMAKDDAVAVKTRKPPKATERVTVRNSIVASDASALKIGTETNALIRDILFENCDVFDSDRGLVLYARDGGPVENIVWRNIRLFMIHWPHETGGTPIQLFITRRHGLTPVRNLIIEHINANVIVPCGLAGLSGAPLNSVLLRNITLRMDAPRGGDSYFRGNVDSYAPQLGESQIARRPDVFKTGKHVDVKLDGLTIDWQGNRHLWNGIADDSSGLHISNLIQIN
jgi:hypothetical protein